MTAGTNNPAPLACLSFSPLVVVLYISDISLVLLLQVC